MTGVIYKAENKINGNVYIGQTIRNLNDRISVHKNNAFIQECNYVFSKALRKYGFENFTWTVLVKTDSKDKLNALEKLYISAYKKMTKIYNMTDGGEGALGYIPTEKTLKKLSESHKGLKSGNKGNKYSEEIRKKMSDSKKKLTGKKNPFYGKKHSAESIKKMSDAKKGKYTGEKNPMYGKSLTAWNKGKTGIYSEETLKKMSKTQFKKGQIPWNKKILEVNDNGQSGNS